VDRKQFRQSVRILEATVGLTANRESLLPVLPPPLEVHSLHTDFYEVERVPYSSSADGKILVVEDSSAPPRYRISGTRAIWEGPLTALSRRASDLRFSLWGNLGFLYRFALFLLEKKHRIYNLHACALYEPSRHRLFVIIGGAGSGKSVYLLGGLERGLSLFSTETVHFRHEGRSVRWFMGSLADNVRVGTLRRHFPRFLPTAQGVPREDEWSQKKAIDLSSYRCPDQSLKDPVVVLLFPRVEEAFGRFVLRPLRDDRQVALSLFANISEKLSQTTILYDRVPVPGFDRGELAEARRRACLDLARHRTIAYCGTVLSGPLDCWGDLLEGGLSKRR
jgi:hypothetical protein